MDKKEFEQMVRDTTSKYARLRMDEIKKAYWNECIRLQAIPGVKVSYEIEKVKMEADPTTYINGADAQ